MGKAKTGPRGYNKYTVDPPPPKFYDGLDYESKTWFGTDEFNDLRNRIRAMIAQHSDGLLFAQIQRRVLAPLETPEERNRALRMLPDALEQITDVEGVWKGSYTLYRLKEFIYGDRVQGWTTDGDRTTRIAVTA